MRWCLQCSHARIHAYVFTCAQALEARQGVMEEPDLIEAVNEIWEEMELHAHPDNPDEKWST
jgi:hypothetical protein